MATAPNPPTQLLISREEAKIRINHRIATGKSLLLSQQAFNPQTYEHYKREFQKWDSYNIEFFKQSFTTPSLKGEYKGTYTTLLLAEVQKKAPFEMAKELNDFIETKIHRLESILGRLDLIPVSSNIQLPVGTQDMINPESIPNKKVFVVHGRDDAAKANLEVFLRELGLEPIVLHRQADEGMTVIEKFEKHSDVGYVFVLLTPDEVAYMTSEEGKDDKERSKERRARPNVIFEFGYFVGKLGRTKVCCLYTGDVSLPSDVSGMIYKKYANSVEEVGYSIRKDLIAAGYGPILKN